MVKADLKRIVSRLRDGGFEGIVAKKGTEDGVGGIHHASVARIGRAALAGGHALQIRRGGGGIVDAERKSECIALAERTARRRGAVGHELETKRLIARIGFPFSDELVALRAHVADVENRGRTKLPLD